MLTMGVEVTRRIGRAVATETLSDADLPSAIGAMDGDELTEVVLTRADETKVLIGGGPDWLTVLLIEGDDDFWDLVGQPNAEGDEDLIVGGQHMSWPRRLCASKDAAIQAGRWFMDHGGRDPGLQGDRQQDRVR